MEGMTTQEIFDRVKSVLAAVSQQSGLTSDIIRSDTNLILDLGLTSVTFLELAIELESRLPIEEFPLQEYIDQENERGDNGFDVQSLLETCRRLIS
ncbi:MAG: hypothetical protein JXA30_20250 [Deltaproteobacteria bacterium]|nr:hypothetical protein [Deltaproteobacteria bacterium]